MSIASVVRQVRAAAGIQSLDDTEAIWVRDRAEARIGLVDHRGLGYRTMLDVGGGGGAAVRGGEAMWIEAVVWWAIEAMTAGQVGDL